MGACFIPTIAAILSSTSLGIGRPVFWSRCPTWSQASDVDIDHMVPLAEAWSSGAWAWTTSRRQTYANDLGGPELWAVTDNVNQSKGDQDPATWQPPLASFDCTYARAWIQVKYYYSLAIDTTEKTSLTGMLDTC